MLTTNTDRLHEIRPDDFHDAFILTGITAAMVTPAIHTTPEFLNTEDREVCKQSGEHCQQHNLSDWFSSVSTLQPAVNAKHC